MIYNDTITITELLKDPQKIQFLTSQGQNFSVFSRSKWVFNIVSPVSQQHSKTAQNLFDLNPKKLKGSSSSNLKRQKMSASEEKNYIRKAKTAKYKI